MAPRGLTERMEPRDIIAALRDGNGLSERAAQDFSAGLASGAVSDAQAGAFAMAVLLQGLDAPGRVALTRAMRDSGAVLSWDLPGPVVDKHSTGGVGDPVSLLLAPALAACGCYVPMISGRGLGHTGGTLDKLESIPGYKAEVPAEKLRRVVAEAGCAIVGASAEIAPADRRLYAIRDISGTVESPDLITASILSKKLAEGLDALVLDVKLGSGAFLSDRKAAEGLARDLVATANGAGCKTSALLTDMNQSLGHSAGNALEVLEVMQTLTGAGVSEALWDVTTALGGELLALCGRAKDPAEGAAMIESALESGRAAEAFGRMVRALGGPGDFVERYPDRLPAAPVVLPVLAERPGFVSRIDTRALGEAVVHLGGGRLRPGDRVIPSVGLSGMVPLAAEVEEGEPLALVHAATEDAAARAVREVRKAYRISTRPPAEPALLYGRVSAEDAGV